jgi:hypothetical protein
MEMDGCPTYDHGSVGVQPPGCRKGRQSYEGRPQMTQVRSIVVTVTILASFLLVLAAPFRWF